MLSSNHAPFLLYTLYLIILGVAQVASQSLLIDDDDAMFTGVGWVVGCGVCGSAVEPLDPTQLSAGTLHSAFFNATSSMSTQSATIQFDGEKLGNRIDSDAHFMHVGTRVAVIGVLFTEFPADYSFYIDNELSGRFSSAGAGPPRTFLYNRTFYSNNTLSNTTHVLQVQNGCIGGSSSLLMLDSFSFDM